MSSREFRVLAGPAAAPGGVVLVPTTPTTNIIQPTVDQTTGVFGVKNAAGTTTALNINTVASFVELGYGLNFTVLGLRIWLTGTAMLGFINTTTISIFDGVNLSLGTISGTKIGTATNQKLAFFNAAPVVQPATTGTTLGFTAGAGTTVVSGSTFTGNTGTAAYTIGDIVLALKQLGLLAA